MHDEWGAWIEHDGKGCRPIGNYVHTVTFSRCESYLIAGSECQAAGEDPNGEGSAWVWDTDPPSQFCVKRYRIRKPRGMYALESALKVKETEDV